jgi:hypothetical protein
MRLTQRLTIQIGEVGVDRENGIAATPDLPHLRSTVLGRGQIE